MGERIAPDLSADMANALRMLSVDMVQRASSGHPGMPMGMADIATVLWRDYLQHDPANPTLPNRDRFVLSNGHGSALLYALLHLSGYELPVEELKAFRQKDSKTPGQPEYKITPGVETTTGPLGQGLANAVGMAMAERIMAQRFNRPDYSLFDHHTYVFVGDGCLMEGVSHEACSLAGHLGLGKLIAFYDDNGISIDGEVQGWFSEDTPGRYKAYGWHVIDRVDGHDMGKITAAIDAAHKTDQPTLICCKTTIGYGAPNKQGTASTHGAPLGKEEVAAARAFLKYPHGEFEVPKAIRQAWDARSAGKQLSAHWKELLSGYAKAYTKEHGELMRRMRSDMPERYNDDYAHWTKSCIEGAAPEATRASSKKCLKFFGERLPELIGGSADLSDSNSTLWDGCVPISKKKMGGNYLHYGVREFGMSAIANGMTLYGGLRPYTATFLVFSDYARNAVRMAALMGAPCIFVYSHDSVALGEDGPTHQPIEHLPALRMIPGLEVWRPADLVETTVAWHCAVNSRQNPIAIVLSRQATEPLPHTQSQLRDIEKGAYLLFEPEDKPQGLIIATGSEIAPALDAARKLSADKQPTRLVAMPCIEAFERQSQKYRDALLPPGLARRMAVEAAHSGVWHKYVGDSGTILSIDTFGESAPGKVLMEHYGMHADAIVERMRGI
jgi:transketolase